jgi:hypothetical protein
MFDDRLPPLHAIDRQSRTAYLDVAGALPRCLWCHLPRAWRDSSSSLMSMSSTRVLRQARAESLARWREQRLWRSEQALRGHLKTVIVTVMGVLCLVTSTMTTFLAASVQCARAVATFSCKVRARCVTETLTCEMAVIAKAGGICNLAESLTCAQAGLAL